jgi:hypothetical protein
VAPPSPCRINMKTTSNQGVCHAGVTRSLGWTIPSCRGVGGIEHDIVFGGASAQGAVSWAAPRVRPGSHLRPNVASIHHSTINKLIQKVSTKGRCTRLKNAVLHADSGILTDKIFVIVKTERFRETDLESEKVFKN